MVFYVTRQAHRWQVYKELALNSTGRLVTITRCIGFQSDTGAPPWSSGSVLDYRSLPPVFKSRHGHIWRLFRLSVRLITFGGRSAHLAYLVHKSGRKTSIIIIIQSDTGRSTRSWCMRIMHFLGLALNSFLLWYIIIFIILRTTSWWEQTV